MAGGVWAHRGTLGSGAFLEEGGAAFFARWGAGFAVSAKSAKESVLLEMVVSWRDEDVVERLREDRAVARRGRVAVQAVEDAWPSRRTDLAMA
jgi:hypothetical protein